LPLLRSPNEFIVELFVKNMITRLSQFVIFFIFTSIAESFQHEVNLKRCANDDMFCFVKDSCMNKTEGITIVREKKLMKYDPNSDKLNNETCDLIMQIKPFTKTKWLVMIKITSELENLKSESGIKFSHKDVLFECNPGMTPDRKLNMTKFGISTFTTAVMHCSVTIEGEKRFDDIFSDGDYAHKNPELSYGTDQGDKTVTFGSKGDIFWNIPTVGTHSCDLTRLHSKDDISEDYSQSRVDTTKFKLTCESPKKLLIIYKDVTRLAEEMHCDNKQFIYREINSANLTEIPDGVQVNVSCAEKFCNNCSVLPLKTCEDENCVLPGIFEDNFCKIYKCLDGKKWRMDDGGLKDGTVECKKKNEINYVGWFQTIDNDTKEITSASCSDKFICRLYSNLNVSCEAEHCKEASYSSVNQSINCIEDGYELNYKGNVLTKLTCNPNNGLYKFGDNHVERNGNVFCQKPLVEGVNSSAEASISPGAITGIAFGVIALIALILVIIAFCVIRRRHSSPTTAPKSLNHSEGVKTAVYAYSRESSTAASGTVEGSTVE
ncbi:hypothetical protein PRIPAC_70908, partial [Pristionchus pacificus]